jgi:sialic acid synthase SpsE
VRSFQLGRKTVGGDSPTYFVADIAANHDGDLSRAQQLIRLAADAGADAVKFQNFRAETIVSEVGFRALGAGVSHQATWDKDVVDVYRDASLPVEWTPALRGTADQCGIDYLTTPYDLDLVPALSPHVAAWKIGSGDITWDTEIAILAASGKPVLLATGAASMADVRRAMDIVLSRTTSVVLMQCNTNYTGRPENFAQISLRVLESYAEDFPDAVLGLSDHTPGHATVLGAVALGARVVEKHFTDDRGRRGPDHGFSMQPGDWEDMIGRTRELEAALGTPEKRVMDNEMDTVVVQRRALRAARDLPAATPLVDADVIALRPCPADGLAPYLLPEVLGRRTRGPIAAGELIRLEDLD